MGVDARVFASVGQHEFIEWVSGIRYFSDVYPRGNWPLIRKQIITLLQRFPEFPVYYMSDQEDWGERGEEYLVTAERLAELDATWEQWKTDPNTEEPAYNKGCAQ